MPVAHERKRVLDAVARWNAAQPDYTVISPTDAARGARGMSNIPANGCGPGTVAAMLVKYHGWTRECGDRHVFKEPRP